MYCTWLCIAKSTLQLLRWPIRPMDLLFLQSRYIHISHESLVMAFYCLSISHNEFLSGYKDSKHYRTRGPGATSLIRLSNIKWQNWPTWLSRRKEFYERKKQWCYKSTSNTSPVLYTDQTNKKTLTICRFVEFQNINFMSHWLPLSYSSIVPYLVGTFNIHKRKRHWGISIRVDKIL